MSLHRLSSKPRYEFIPIDKIELKPGEYNVRRRDIEKEVDELAANIKQYGILQPIIVNKIDDKYVPIAGQRRVLAAQRAGLKEVPAIVYENLDKRQAIEISLSESVHRVEVTDVDLMDAVTSLFIQYGSVKAVAQLLGKSEGWVRKYLKMEVKLPDKVKKDEKLGVETKATLADLSAKTESALGKEKAEDLVIKVAEEIKKEGLKTEDARRLVKAVAEVASKAPTKSVEEIIKDAKSLYEKEQARKEEEKKAQELAGPGALIVKLPEDAHKALEEASKVKMRAKEDVAVEYIIDGLYRDGYLKRA
jgi:ParB family chromosome partitioning protein